MIREDGLTICDYSSICVNDGAYIAQGYLKLTDKGLYKHTTPKLMPTGLKNKSGKEIFDSYRGVAQDVVVEILPTTHTTDKTLHFLDEEAMELYFKERV